jgi:hypothetical protein
MGDAEIEQRAGIPFHLDTALVKELSALDVTLL